MVLGFNGNTADCMTGPPVTLTVPGMEIFALCVEESPLADIPVVESQDHVPTAVVCKDQPVGDVEPLSRSPLLTRFPVGGVKV
jgi:hypothetical protein